ncbi:MAG: molecular chaperone DnaJ [Clostridia bacterium]|nr:molecular chaperone DnaJ [Clostridia bacterium]
MAQDYYKILGVDKNATEDEIKTAYRKLVKQYHPDLHPNDPDAAAKFKEINEANEVLSNPEKRKQYDFEQEHPYAAGSGGGFSGGFSDFGGGFSDIFGDIFSQFTGSGSSSSAARAKGQNVELELSLSFLDAAKGCRKEVSYTRRAPCSACSGTGADKGTAYTTCSKCGGSGQVQYVTGSSFFRTVSTRACPDCNGTGKKILTKCSVCGGKGYSNVSEKFTFDIPAGADNNSYIKKREMGHASQKGGSPGDLIILFKVLPHKIFKRKDFNLYVELPISFKTACLGGKVKIPTLDNAIDLEIPEGTQTGKTFTLRGKGIRSRTEIGNLYVTVVVETPSKLTKQQKSELSSALNKLELKQSAKMSDYDKNLQSLYGEKAYENQ